MTPNQHPKHQFFIVFQLFLTQWTSVYKDCLSAIASFSSVIASTLSFPSLCFLFECDFFPQASTHPQWLLRLHYASSIFKFYFNYWCFNKKTGFITYVCYSCRPKYSQICFPGPQLEDIISNDPTFTAICYNGKTTALKIQASVLWQSHISRTEIHFRKVICFKKTW